MKKKKIYPLTAILIGIITCVLITIFCCLHAMASNKQHRIRCERCIELEYAITQLLTVIEEDQTDYMLDVLSETDEWAQVDYLLNEECIVPIPDSTYHRLHTVFPDLPKEQ